ncbi:MAG: methyl-accepting chemotaxis protein, partial [Myxococcota bacterium]
MISAKIGILAINARIEAARAGEEGRGFAVVAESIGQLSKQTAQVTRTISEDIQTFASFVSTMKSEADGMTDEARATIEASARGDAALSAISQDMNRTTSEIKTIADRAAIAGEDSA